MKIEKIYNNNVVQILDEAGNEVVVMGRGLAFGKKVGQELDSEKIEKTFVNQESFLNSEWSEVYQVLAPGEAELIMDIVTMVEEQIQQDIDLPFYFALADHLHYAIERTQQGISIQNPLSWEIRKFYPAEFQLGLTVLDLIRERTTVQLAEDEAASLALHFVNVQKDSGLLSKNYRITQMVVAVLEIVRLHYGGATFADESSVNYNRFVTHVHYFGQRVMNGMVQGNNDAFLYEQVAENYPNAFACTQKIKAYVQSEFDFEMSGDEEVYLTIHIQRLMS